MASGYPTGGVQGEVLSGYAHYENQNIKTIDAGYAIPGRLVIRDTDDRHVQIAGAGSAVIAGFLAPTPDHDDDIDYTTEDEVRVGKGPCIVNLTLTTGQTATKNQLLYPAAHGALKTTATGSEPAIAKAEQSVTTTTLAEAGIVVRYLQ